MNTDQNKSKQQSFWTVKATNGRPAIFKEPEKMWESAVEYFTWCQDNPLIGIDFKGKDAKRVEMPKMRPFTMIGLAHHLHVNEKYFNDFYDNVKGKKSKKAKGFSEVITQIRETVKRQKFEGAAAGFLDARIISLDLGMAQKQEVEHSGDAITSFHITMDQIPKGQELPSDESQIDLTRDVKK